MGMLYTRKLALLIKVSLLQATIKVKAKELRGKKKEDLEKQLLELKTVSFFSITKNTRQTKKKCHYSLT